jgi:peptidoglycan hydrolase-like protein with peptidoglycan-binding domain
MIALKLVPARPVSGATTPSPGTPTTPAKPTPAKPTPAKPTTSSPLAPYAKTTIRRGSTGAAVRALQKAVSVTVDGGYGPITEGAVKAFQARRNLPANGICGPATWAALMGQSTTPTTVPASGSGSTASGGTVSRGATRTATPYTAVLTTVLRPGSRGAAVKTLQRALGGLAVDGAYGPRTAAVVKAFQKSHRLPVTGVADTKVWRALEARDYPLHAYYDTVLRTGSRGGAVVTLQRALRVAADGIYGPKTAAAVKALQGRARLARTGTVATLTWKALEAELRRR